MTAGTKRRRAGAPAAALRTVGRVGGALAATVALSACSKDGAATSKPFCDQLKARSSTLVDFSGPPAAKATADAFTSLERLAPSEIKSDWHTLATLFTELASAQIKTSTDYQNALKATLSGGMQQAAENVTGFVKDTCGLDLNKPASAGTTAAGAAPAATTAAAATATTMG